MVVGGGGEGVVVGVGVRLVVGVVVVVVAAAAAAVGGGGVVGVGIVRGGGVVGVGIVRGGGVGVGVVAYCPCSVHRLVGLVDKASASRAADPGFDSRLRRGDFSWPSHTSDINIGTPVAALPDAWRYRISIGTGRPGVSIL